MLPINPSHDRTCIEGKQIVNGLPTQQRVTRPAAHRDHRGAGNMVVVARHGA